MLDLGKLVGGVPLGDSRRNARALEIIMGVVQGQASATHGTQGTANEAPWAHAMGAYRFFDNEAIELPALYGMVRQGLSELVAEGQRCFVVHDFSCIDYATHEAKHDRIQISNRRSLGYDLYTALVVDQHGRALGPVIQELRTSAGCLSSCSVEPLPFDSHLQQTERGVAGAHSYLPGRTLVHVMDREFDDVHLARALTQQQDGYVIRAQHLSRWVLGPAGRIKLGDVVGCIGLQPVTQIERLGKPYDVYQGETRVVFAGPSRRGITQSKTRGTMRPPPTPGPALAVRVVVTELRECKTGEKLRWVLLTNLNDPIGEIVLAYLWRWRIERLFYLVKVGFRLEHWRQESGPRIARRLALSSLSAMVIYQLQSASTDPETELALKHVATLGGWLGRKRDPLGPIVLMRGIQTLLGTMAAVDRYGIEKLRHFAQELGLDRLKKPARWSARPGNLRNRQGDV